MIDLDDQHLLLCEEPLQFPCSLPYACLKLLRELAHALLGIESARYVEVGQELVGDRALPIVEGAGEQHGPERRPVLPILLDLQRLAAPLLHGSRVLPNSVRVRTWPVQEMRVLPVNSDSG
jgi:hypothetical protein